MPGGRLTQQERQQIALGLADSLPYAEIARRLERPTSTITREVMRNGGPTAYRADLAHRATEQPRPPAQARLLPRTRSLPQPHGRDAEAVARVRGDAHHRPHGFGPAQDGGPRPDLPVHHRRGQPHRVRTRPAPPGQPGVHLQGDRFPGEPEPRPPRTRRTPPRPLRRRRRALLPGDDRQRPSQRPARRNRTAGRRYPRPATPLPPPAWRTSPASSTSSARASPAPPNRPAKSSTPNPKQPRPTSPKQARTSDGQPFSTIAAGRIGAVAGAITHEHLPEQCGVASLPHPPHRSHRLSRLTPARSNRLRACGAGKGRAPGTTATPTRHAALAPTLTSVRPQSTGA